MKAAELVLDKKAVQPGAGKRVAQPVVGRMVELGFELIHQEHQMGQSVPEVQGYRFVQQGRQVQLVLQGRRGQGRQGNQEHQGLQVYQVVQQGQRAQLVQLGLGRQGNQARRVCLEVQRVLGHRGSQVLLGHH